MVQSPANSIFGMLMATGCFCLIGLAAKSPLRVGIDVAWGVEYQPRELYGKALVCSYNLKHCSKSDINDNLICKAQEFIESELQRWQKEGNEKLSIRYQETLSYFQRNRTGV
jgi:hypothetical protein